ncbi:hemagglutinin repeat-containing protein [Thalassolituus alkanivorans]|uniref:hemagglutinin repeat-containing protein n=1 Tax=Thalassolituus alkanivorans TaxID=2881055 RepID=UPI002E1D11CB|nr:hemagglutinin repeat-containing protein [Thalassolituus alkanivorans]
MLNEVTGASDSDLNGLMEVFGDKANIIIANPNGITCDGCGFINTDRASMITGRSFYSDDQLNFDIRDGSVRIEGEGLSYRYKPKALDLLGRYIGIHGEVDVPDSLNIIAGTYDLNYDALISDDNSSTAVTVKSPEGTPDRALAIDASVFGAMQAGKINIMGTEKGLGVKADGYLFSHADDLFISSAGGLTVSDADAFKKLTLVAEDELNITDDLIANLSVSVSGNVVSTGDTTSIITQDLTINADSEIDLNGETKSLNLLLSSNNLRSSANLLVLNDADIQTVDNALFQDGDIRINTASLVGGKFGFLDSVLSVNILNANTHQWGINNSRFEVSDLTLATDESYIDNAFILVNQLDVNAGSMVVTGSRMSGLDMRFQGSSLGLTDSSWLFNNIDAKTEALDLKQALLMSYRTDLNTAVLISENSSYYSEVLQFRAGADFTSQGDTFQILSFSGEIGESDAGTLDINAGNADFSDTNIRTERFNLTGNNLALSAGEMLASDIFVTSSSFVAKESARIVATNELAVVSDTIVANAQMYGGNLSVEAADAALSGRYEAADNMSITSGQLATKNSVISARNLAVSGQDLALDATQINAQDVVLSADDDASFSGSVSAEDLKISAQNIDITGQMQLENSAQLTATNALSANSILITADDFAATASQLSINQADIQTGAIQLHANKDAKLSGSIVANELTLTADNAEVSGDYALSDTMVVTAGNRLKSDRIVAQAIDLMLTGNNLEINNNQLTASHISLEAQQDIELSGSVKGKVLLVNGRNADISGHYNLADNLSVTAENQLTINDSDITAKNFSLSGNDLKASEVTVFAENAKLEAMNDASLSASVTGNSLSINAQNVNLSGQYQLAGNVQISAENRLTTDDAEINTADLALSATDLTFSQTDIRAVNSQLTAKKDLTFSGSVVGTSLSVQASNNASLTGNYALSDVLSVAAGNELKVNGIVAEAVNLMLAGDRVSADSAVLESDQTVLTATNDLILSGSIVGNDLIINAANADISGQYGLSNSLSVATTNQLMADNMIAVTDQLKLDGQILVLTNADITADSLYLTSRQDTQLSGVVKGNNLIVRAANADLSGQYQLSDQLSVIASDKLTGQDVSASAKNISLGSQNIILTSAGLAADNIHLVADEDIKISGSASGNSLTIAAQNTDLSGQYQFSDNITARAENQLSTDNADITTASLILTAADLVLTETNIVADSTELVADRDLSLSGTMKGNSLTARSGSDAQLSGEYVLSDTLSVTTDRDLIIDGVVAQAVNLMLNGDNLQAHNVMLGADQAKLMANQNLTISGSLTGNSLDLTASNVNVAGDYKLADNLNIVVADKLTATDADFTTSDLNLAGNNISAVNIDINAEATSLIAKQNLNLSGSVSGNDLIVQAGFAEIDGSYSLADQLSVIAQSDITSTTVSINANNLNLKADNITLDNLEVSAGSSYLNADKNISLTGTGSAPVISGDHLSVNAGTDITLTGSYLLADDMSVTAGHDLDVDNIAASSVNILLQGNSISAHGVTLEVNEAQLNSNNELSLDGDISGNNLTVTADQAEISGSFDLSSTLSVITDNELFIDDAHLSASALALKADDLVMNNVSLTTDTASLVADNDIELKTITANTTTASLDDDYQWSDQFSVLAGNNLVINNMVSAAINQMLNAGNNAQLHSVELLADTATIITAQQLDLKGRVDATSLNLTAADASVSGTYKLADSLAITTSNDLGLNNTDINSDKLSVAGNNVNVSASRVNADEIQLTAAQQLNLVAAIAGESLTVTADTASLQGQFDLSDTLSLTTDTHAVLNNSDVAAKNLEFRVGDGEALLKNSSIITTSTDLIADDVNVKNSILNGASVEISSNNLILDADSELGADNVDINVAGRVENSGNILAADELSVIGSNISNNGSVASFANAVIKAANVFENNGVLTADSLVLSGSDVINNNQLGAEYLDLTYQNLANNSGADLVSGNTVYTAKSDTALFNNHGTQTITGTVSWQSEGGSAGTYINAGTLQGSHDVNFSGLDSVENHKLGVILSNGAVQIGNEKFIQQGRIDASTLNIVRDRQEFFNQGDVFADTLNIDSSAGLVNGGNIVTEIATIDLSKNNPATYNRFISHEGSMLSAHDLSISGADIDNAGQWVATNISVTGSNGVTIKPDFLNRKTGVITQRYSESESGSVLDFGSAIFSGFDRFFNMGSIESDELILVKNIREFSNNEADLATHQANNTLNEAAGIRSAGGLIIENAGSVTNSGLLIASSLSMSGGPLNNQGIIGAGEAKISLADNLLTNNGTIYQSGLVLNDAQRNRILNNPDAVSNQTTAGVFDLNSGSFVNGDNASVEITNGSIALTKGHLENRGLIRELNDGNIETALHLNGIGLLENYGDISLTSALVLKDAGALRNYGSDSYIQAGSITGAPAAVLEDIHNDGILLVRDQIDLQSKTISNNIGASIFANNISLTSQDLISNVGFMQSEADLSLKANRLHNGGELIGKGTTSVTVNRLENEHLIYGNTLNVGSASQHINEVSVSSAIRTQALAENQPTGLVAAETLNLYINGIMGGVYQASNIFIDGNDLSVSGALIGDNQIDINANTLTVQQQGNIDIGNGAGLSRWNITGALNNHGDIDFTSDLNITSASFQNTGNVRGEADFEIDTGRFENRSTGVISTKNSASGNGSSIRISGLADGFSAADKASDWINNGQIHSDDGLDIAAENIIVNGNVKASGDSQWHFNQLLNNDRITIDGIWSLGTAENRSGSIINNDRMYAEAIDAYLSGDVNNMVGSKIVAYNDDVTLDTLGNIYNKTGSYINAKNSFHLTSVGNINNNGSIESLGAGVWNTLSAINVNNGYADSDKQGVGLINTAGSLLLLNGNLNNQGYRRSDSTIYHEQVSNYDFSYWRKKECTKKVAGSCVSKATRYYYKHSVDYLSGYVFNDYARSQVLSGGEIKLNNGDLNNMVGDVSAAGNIKIQGALNNGSEKTSYILNEVSWQDKNVNNEQHKETYGLSLESRYNSSNGKVSTAAKELIESKISVVGGKYYWDTMWSDDLTSNNKEGSSKAPGSFESVNEFSLGQITSGGNISYQADKSFNNIGVVNAKSITSESQEDFSEGIYSSVSESNSEVDAEVAGAFSKGSFSNGADSVVVDVANSEPTPTISLLSFIIPGLSFDALNAASVAGDKTAEELAAQAALQQQLSAISAGGSGWKLSGNYWQDKGQYTPEVEKHTRVGNNPPRLNNWQGADVSIEGLQYQSLTPVLGDGTPQWQNKTTSLAEIQNVTTGSVNLPDTTDWINSINAPDLSATRAELNQARSSLNKGQDRSMNNGRASLFDLDPDILSRIIADTEYELQPDYIFKRLTDTQLPDTEPVFLLDPYQEAQAITQAALAQTGTAYFSPDWSSSAEQRQALYDNTVSYLEQHQSNGNLQVGQALTRDQIAQLEAPMIWYVSMNIGGTQQLVPTVYLPEATLEQITTPAAGSIVADSMDISVGDFTNTGNINVKNSANIYAESFKNQRNVMRFGDGTNYNTIAGNGGNISAGSLSVVASNDINNNGGSLTTSGDMNLQAGGDINFNALQLDRRSQRGKNIDEHTEFLTSQIRSGGNASFRAGGDFNSEAAKFDIGGDALVDAENINLQGVTERDYQQRYSEKKGTFSSSKTTTQQETLTFQGTELGAGGNLLLNARNDMTLVGADVSAGGNATLNAENNILITAGINQDSYSKEKSGSGVATTSAQQKGHVKQEAVGSTIRAGGGAGQGCANAESAGCTGSANLQINSNGGDVAILASSVAAENNITLGDTNLLRDENGAPVLDDNGQFISADGSSIGNLTVGTVELKDEEWNVKQSGLKGPLKNLASAAMFVAGSMGVTSQLEALGVDTTLTVGHSEEQRVETTHNATSSVDAGGNLIVRVDDHLQVDGSQINAAGNGYIETGSTTITAVMDTTTTTESSSEQTVASTKPAVGKQEVTVAGVTATDHTETTTTTQETAVTAGLNVGGNLIMNSEGDINLLGSDLSAGGDASLTAQNINVEGVTENSSTTHTEKTEVSTTSLGVKNAYVDAVYAADAVAQAGADVEAAKNALADAERRIKDGSLAASALDDYKANLAAATTQLAQATLNFAAAGATAAGSTGTGGFYASASAQTTTTEKESTSTSQTYVGSNINVGGNASFNATDALNIIGSSVNVQDQLALNGNSVTITAGTEESTSSSSEQTYSAGMSFSNSGGNDSFSANASANSSESDSYSKTHVNSSINAGSLTSTSDQLTIAGANIEIQNDIDITTGQLTIASLQDESRSSSHSEGYNVSGSVGGSLPIDPSNVGGNQNDSSSDSKWVNNQTTLIGGASGNGKVTINADTTEITGATVASATRNEDGTLTDNGNLALITDELTINNLYDHNTSESRGVNLSVGTGWSGDKPETDDNEGYASGSTTVGLTNNGHNTEQTTYATLGGGTVQKKDGTAHDIADVNNDLSNTQEITLDQQTGGLDATVTVDHRLFSDGGQNAIAKDVVDSVEHGKEIVQAAKDVANTDQSALDFFSNVNNYATERKVLAAAAADEKQQNKLRGDEGAEGSEEGLQKLSDALTDAQGLENGADISLYDGSQLQDNTLAIDSTAVNKTEVEGAYHENGDGIYVNIDNTDMTNSTDTVSTLVHEQTRHRLAQEGQTGSLSRDDQTTLATNHGDRAGEVWDAYSGLAGISTQGNGTQQQWNAANQNSSNVQQGTQNIAAINNNELKARQLNRNEASLLDQARANINNKANLSAEQKAQEIADLEALACVAVECAAGVSEHDPLYEKVRGLQDRGQELKAQGEDIKSTLNVFGVNTQAADDDFAYGLKDKIDDKITSHENIVAGTQQSVATAGGMIEAAGGALIATGGCAATVGLGCGVAILGGGALASHGTTQAIDSYNELIADHQYQSGSNVLNSFSADTHPGEVSPTTDAGIDLAIGTVEAAGGALIGKMGMMLKEGSEVAGNAATQARREEGSSFSGNNGSYDAEGDFGYLNQETPRVYVDAQPSKIELSNGIVIDANPEKTTTVLGKYDYQGSGTEEALEITNYPKTYDIGEKEGGFNLLNIPDQPANVTYAEGRFWEEYNQPLLDEAINRGDDFALTTIPTASSKGDFVNEFGPVGMYGKELEYLVEKQVKPVNLSDTDWNMVNEWFQNK